MTEPTTEQLRLTVGDRVTFVNDNRLGPDYQVYEGEIGTITAVQGETYCTVKFDRDFRIGRHLTHATLDPTNPGWSFMRKNLVKARRTKTTTEAW